MAEPAGDASLGVVESEDWFYDDDGAVIMPYALPPAVTEKEACGISAACDAFTIVSIEILPDGRFGALEFASIPGLELSEGEVVQCASLIVDRAAKTVTIEFGDEAEDCCEMKVESLGGVVRMSCSGSCDNGEDCALQSETVNEITVFTCACPDVP